MLDRKLSSESNTWRRNASALLLASALLVACSDKGGEATAPQGEGAKPAATGQGLPVKDLGCKAVEVTMGFPSNFNPEAFAVALGVDQETVRANGVLVSVDCSEGFTGNDTEKGLRVSVDGNDDCLMALVSADAATGQFDPSKEVHQGGAVCLGKG